MVGPAPIPVSNPGTTEAEWNEFADGTRFFTKRWVPEGNEAPKAAVLFVHGFADYIERYDHCFPLFASRQVELTAYDQRGFGRTWTEHPDPHTAHGNTSWPEQFADIELMVKKQRARLDEKWGVGKVPLFLYGHSMGGGLTLGFFTRPTEGPGPSQETKDLLSGAIASAPWLRLVPYDFVTKLTSPPTASLRWIAKTVMKYKPDLRWSAPLKAENISRDLAVREAYSKDPLCDGNVYLKTIATPLIGGEDIFENAYKRWPENLPLLVAHGDADKVTDHTISKKLVAKLKANDKEYKEWPGFFHETMNEPGQDKADFINYIIDWIHKHVSSTPTAASATQAASELGSSTNTGKKCWATLLTKEKYLPGLAVFAQSLLRDHKSQYPLVVMVTPQLSQRGRDAVRGLGCVVRDVEFLDPGTKATDLAFSHFTEVWTKLRAFDLTEYERVVMVDSDMLVMRNMDELMEQDLPEGSIASGFACTCNPNKISTYPADWIPANCAFTPQEHPSCLTHPTQIGPDSPRTHKLLNSGLVVLRPSSETMKAMFERITTDPVVPTFRFPDQDFLADFYQDKWQPLPWCYNALKKLRACHPAMWRDEEVRNVHYIIDKPWVTGWPGPEGVDSDAVVHGWWWDAYRRTKAQMGGLSADLWEECVVPHVNDKPRHPIQLERIRSHL